MTALAISNIVLWIVVLALLAVVLALTRQLGVLHERIAPVGALMLNRGLAVGEKAPAVDVDDLNGGRLQVGSCRFDAAFADFNSVSSVFARAFVRRAASTV